MSKITKTATSGALAMLKNQVAKKQQVAKAKENGRVRTDNFGREHLVLVLDLSASMWEPMRRGDFGGPQKVQVLEDAAGALLGASRRSMAAIVTYGTRVSTLCGFRPAVDCTDELLAAKSGMRRIIFMSDGQDYRVADAVSRARALEGQGVVIDTVAFGQDADRDFLQMLTSADGTMVEGSDARSLVRSFLSLEATARGLLTAG
jgi:hypothetical protein